MGMEVGYSVGLGDVCTSDSTRIEFMTHGMFISRAHDPEKIITTYCAVVLDEAHDGSVDVDLCFAILRQCLDHTVGRGRKKLFKVKHCHLLFPFFQFINSFRNLFRW